MKGTHYKVKAAKAREDWNRLKEKDSSEEDSKKKGKLHLDKIDDQSLEDKTIGQEEQTNGKSKPKKRQAPLRVAHKLSNAS